MLISFYRFWHGRLRLKGAGLIVRLLAPYFGSLQSFPLLLPEGQILRLDFRDVSAWYWVNYVLGDKLEEAGLVEAVCRASKPGDVIWDVGANCGLLSYLLARRLPDCRIIFFEPNRAVYEIACAALQPFSQVSGINIGLSCRKQDHVPLVVPAGGSAVGTVEPQVLGEGNYTLHVALDAGDRLVEQVGLPAPNTIKIDTEGHEADVLTGLARTIANLKPMVFFEHISLSDDRVKKLVPFGFKLCSVSNRTGEFTMGFDRFVGHNSALLPESSTLGS